MRNTDIRSALLIEGYTQDCKKEVPFFVHTFIPSSSPSLSFSFSFNREELLLQPLESSDSRYAGDQCLRPYTQNRQWSGRHPSNSSTRLGSWKTGKNSREYLAPCLGRVSTEAGQQRLVVFERTLLYKKEVVRSSNLTSSSAYLSFRRRNSIRDGERRRLRARAPRSRDRTSKRSK